MLRGGVFGLVLKYLGCGVSGLGGSYPIRKKKVEELFVGLPWVRLEVDRLEVIKCKYFLLNFFGVLELIVRLKSYLIRVFE